jgi:pimeloyl-ACP methyl ester carboxylesterase
MFFRWILATIIGLSLFANARLRAEDRFFDSKGVKIHFVVVGQGEPVLLVHGFAANIHFQWGMPGVLKSLAKDYQVIALDCRGHGQSGKPHDPQMYGMEVVEDLIRLLDHLKIQKAHVVGYSLGAFITLKLITTHPERLLSATLGGAGWSKTLDTRFRDELAESLEKGNGIGPLLLMLTPPGRPKPTEEQLKLASQLLALVNDIKALAAITRGLNAVFTVPEEDLQQCKVPTLSIIGEIDPLKKGVDDLKGRLSDLKIIVVPGADHMNAFWKPEFIQGLKEFLAQHRTMPSSP